MMSWDCAPAKNFVIMLKNVFKILPQRAQELGISRTVHAGEAGPAASVHEVSDDLLTQLFVC